MDTIKLITGIIFTVIGIILLVVSVFFAFALIYAIPIFAIGIALLFNAGNEDKIEGIRKSNKNIKKVGR